MKIREMRDAQAVELGRQAGQYQLPYPQTHPPCLEPPVRSDDRRKRDEPREQ